jgi:hypothetical protein
MKNLAPQVGFESTSFERCRPPFRSCLPPQDQDRESVCLNAALAAEAALVLCAEARAIATGSIAVDIEIAVLLLTAAHRSVLMCIGSNLRET